MQIISFELFHGGIEFKKFFRYTLIIKKEKIMKELTFAELDESVECSEVGANIGGPACAVIAVAIAIYATDTGVVAKCK